MADQNLTPVPEVTEYNNPTPVTVALIFNPERTHVLTGERTIEPMIGGRALISGYIDDGETPEIALVREVDEETGMLLDQPVLTYESSANTGASNRMLLFFSTTVPSFTFDNVADTSEMRNIRWTSCTELLQNPLCFPLHQKALVKACTKYGIFPDAAPSMS